MCCLFGLIDYGHHLTGREKTRMLSVLAAACEVRGTDATGIAYNLRGDLQIYKRPLPAHRMHFRIPDGVWAVMGHTRMTTQGSERRNCNNHPFPGVAGKDVFALAHNGVLCNDGQLRRSLHLPGTKIQMDSYIAVQLMEQKKALNFDTLRYMAEQVEGSFTFTVLDRRDRLYVVKGDNPFCLYHYPSLGFYLYASTEEILRQAVSRMDLEAYLPCRIPLDCGEILRIDQAGDLERGRFDDTRLFARWQSHAWGLPYLRGGLPDGHRPSRFRSYLDEVKAVAPAFGYDPEEIEQLAGLGYSPEELEDFLYCGEL